MKILCFVSVLSSVAQLGRSPAQSRHTIGSLAYALRYGRY
jgi:hypothetical protein